jgi:hypothetical protein
LASPSAEHAGSLPAEADSKSEGPEARHCSGGCIYMMDQQRPGAEGWRHLVRSDALTQRTTPDPTIPADSAHRALPEHVHPTGRHMSVGKRKWRKGTCEPHRVHRNRRLLCTCTAGWPSTLHHVTYGTQVRRQQEGKTDGPSVEIVGHRAASPISKPNGRGAGWRERKVRPQHALNLP